MRWLEPILLLILGLLALGLCLADFAWSAPAPPPPRRPAAWPAVTHANAVGVWDVQWGSSLTEMTFGAGGLYAEALPMTQGVVRYEGRWRLEDGTLYVTCRMVGRPNGTVWRHSIPLDEKWSGVDRLTTYPVRFIRKKR
jgi:hypothetical protein